MTISDDCSLSGWEAAALADVCQVVQGQSPPGETYNADGMGLPFLQAKAEFGDTYPTAVKWCSTPTKIAEPDDVLISIRAPVGPTNLCPAQCCIGRGLATIRPQGGIPSKYILYSLRATEQELRTNSTGTTFEAIRGDDLRSHHISVAPLGEQHRIVAEIETQFTRLDTSVAALRRAQANLKRYRASVLKAACESRLVPTEAEQARSEGRGYEPAAVLLERILAERRARWESQEKRRGKYKEPSAPDTSTLPELPEGWAWATLSEFSELKGGVTKGQRYKNEQSLREVPYLRVANVQRGFLDLKRISKIETSQENIEQLRLIPGDVLFTEGGDRDKLGRGWVWKGEIGECIHQNHVFRARLLPNSVIPEFVSWWGNSFGQDFFSRFGKQTTNLASINLTVLSQFPIPLPPQAEQRRIVAEVERRLSVVQQAEATVKASLARAERLRQSILKQAFSGKLVPQDPDDEPASVLLERIRAEREAEAQESATSKGKSGRRTTSKVTA